MIIRSASVKRILALTLALLLAAACSQPENATTAPEANADQSGAPQGSVDRSAASQEAAPEAAATAAQAGAETQTTNAAAAPSVAADTADRTQVAQADLSAVEAAGFVEGRNYTRLSPTQPTGSSPEQVEVNEFFMYSCPHCYDLEPYVEDWVKSKPSYINFVPVPTTWDDYRKLHARAYYAEQALGKVDEMHMAFFQEIHLNGNYLDTPDKIADFFGKFGVSRKEFDSVFDSFKVNIDVNRADELGRRYGVDSTPTFIVNGKYRTDVGMAGGTPEQLFKLVNALAAAELGR
jgi:thiol:disulfide interchange protein DsbA